MFENMNYVYEVYKEGSFSKAAKKLFISQPSLSASIKRIEDRLGYKIFDRTQKPLKLTELGEKYIESMMAIRRIEQDFQSYLESYGDLKTGTLRLAGTNLVASLILPPLIERFHLKYPLIETELSEGTSSEIEKMLTDGEIDMVADYTMPNYDMFDHKTISDEYLILTVPKSFEINRSLLKYQIPLRAIKDLSFIDTRYPIVPLESFSDVPFVMLRRVNDTAKRAMKLCNAAGFYPRVSFEAPQQMTGYHICASGLGAAFVSSILLSRMAENPSLSYYKVDPRYAKRELRLLWKKDKYFTRAMREFSNIVFE